MTTKLLTIDDDVNFTTLLASYLTPEGFILTASHDGESALKKALNQSFDAILLDIHLPQKNGFDVLQSIRQHQHTPIIVLTARGDDIDRVLCLEAGADDYLQKPCNPRELLARLRTILKRTHAISSHKSHAPLAHQGITLDMMARTATQAGKPLELTNTEFTLLEMLMRTPNQAFSKEELTEYALGRKLSAYDRSIDVHISHLRIKLNDSGPVPLIKTIRGFGYSFCAP